MPRCSRTSSWGWLSMKARSATRSWSRSTTPRCGQPSQQPVRVIAQRSGLVKVKAVCVCGSEFETTPSRLASGRGRFCSRACGYANRTRPSGLVYNVANENPTAFKAGQEPWNKGLRGTHFSPETEFKTGGRPSPATEFKPGQLSGSANPKWAGDDVQYGGLHQRLYHERGNAADYLCTHEDQSCYGRMQWANISHEYRDVQDFMPLCQSHHRRYDQKFWIESRLS